MDKIREYISTLSEMLGLVFKWTELTAVECKFLAEIGKLELAAVNEKNLSTNQTEKALEELRGCVVGLVTLFQFGDIIDQSFESFDVIFNEISRLENPHDKLNYDQAERFSRLVGAVSTNTFYLIGRTLVQLREKLDNTEKILCTISGKAGVSFSANERQVFSNDFFSSVEKCIKSVGKNIDGIESSARQAAISTEGIGLFCIEKIISFNGAPKDSLLAERLYERFRVREHIEILSGLFPADKSYSDTGSLEFF